MQTEKSRVSTPCPTPVGIFKEAFVGGGGGRTRWEQYVKSAEEAGEAGMTLALGEEGGSPLSTPSPPRTWHGSWGQD